ncbi:MAG TPA: type IX secretion system sortase PorU [Saprospiraceae bacterium]|nr:type IX secretion system sortase PorU [Saprospiraceae bacterium]
MKNYLSICFFLLSFGPLLANPPFYVAFELDWSEPIQEIKVGDQGQTRLRFDGAFFDESRPLRPLCYKTFPVDGPGEIFVQIESVSYQSLESSMEITQEWPRELQFQTSLRKDRGQYFGSLEFIPVIREGSGLKAVKTIRLRVEQRPSPTVQPRSGTFTTESQLRNGNVYKMAVSRPGIYKLTYNFLKDELGVPIDAVDVQNLQVLSNLGGMVPQGPGPDYRDDLEVLPMYTQGLEDGQFEEGDYIIVYSQGPDRWFFNASTRSFEFEKNLYDTQHYLFLKVGSGSSRNISSETRNDISVSPFEYFDDFQVLEEEKVNLLHYWGETLGKAHGSGQTWYGDHFRNARSYTYNSFEFPNLITNSPVQVYARMALRAEQRSRFSLSINGQAVNSEFANRVGTLSGPLDNINNYAFGATLRNAFTVDQDAFSVEVAYPFPQSSSDGSEAWLDFIEINARRQLSMVGQQMAFQVVETSSQSRAAYRLSNAQPGLQVWNITDPLNYRHMEGRIQVDSYDFEIPGTQNIVPRFIAFYPDQIQQTPAAVGEIPNQNLHALDQVDMVILTTEELEAEAQRLAEHRAAYSGLRVEVVLDRQVYNEFNSGKRDAGAIRDFARMLYNRDENFRYLLLFGDGSFDHKDIYGLGNNLLPTYQQESFNPLFAFPADDYYTILEEGAGLSALSNISVGRIPVNTALEARQAVDKIIKYDANPQAFSDWRNRLVFVADDEDGNLHLRDADEIAEEIREDFRFFNQNKIYLDAFPQVSTPGGNRFPEVTRALNEAVFKGSLVITYLGHGGEEGWAQERILNISDIQQWNNADRMPLLMTATCSFTSYDDPTFTSGGEEAFLNPRGGSFALMTTTRAVYANQNAQLTEATLDRLFTKVNGRYPSLGEAMRTAKNALPGSSIITNSRKFTLIGDPAQQLAIPEYQIRTSQIDDEDITGGQTDTLRALQIVKISGEVLDLQGQLFDGFSGIVYPTIYDKPLTLKTLGQDQGSREVDYSVQRNVIFTGRASVQNGRFTFSFVIPKDINYELGFGKISYYAVDQGDLVDATGLYDEIIIGGSNADAVADDQGPEIEVFMNTEDFVFGGVTDASPTLLVQLEDDYGINVVGNSIGHDLEAVLDDDTQNTFLLNDFFQAELDDYRRGEVRFPLSDLEEGLHTLRVKAWDVANNSAEGYTEFLVTSSEEFILNHVLNYPNPFTDRTCFQFDHNNANQDLEVMVQIYTVSGRLVKTLQANIFSDGAIRQDDCIEWDGRDDYGGRLARGVYLYKVRVRSNTPGLDPITGESDFQKLVLLK